VRNWSSSIKTLSQDKIETKLAKINLLLDFLSYHLLDFLSVISFINRKLNENLLWKMVNVFSLLHFA
jgi:hypothetical protein